MEFVKKSINERARYKREYNSWVNERHMQTTEEKVDTSKTLDARLVDTESSGTKLVEQDTSSRLGNDAHADDADIRPIYDEEPMAEGKESAYAKPHHMIAPGSSRYNSNDMVHNHYLEEAKNKTHDIGRWIASFQDDAKYEHVGQDTRSQGGKDLKEKELKISDSKTKSKDNDKSSRSKIAKRDGTSLQCRQRPRSQELNDKSNLIDLTKECHNKLTSREIVRLKY
uniref:Uncharacterized protein n=1 Tax=Tanacetum cinerariifolium TaxID=118510 RepID=A0A699H8I2_TANCI|nr:hypothetical protein [Tanacetum cinerariifolium]